MSKFRFDFDWFRNEGQEPANLRNNGNTNHPERSAEEFFLTNVSADRVAAIESGEDEFMNGYDGIRVGKVAYNIRGQEMPNDCPVFARRFKDEHQ